MPIAPFFEALNSVVPAWVFIGLIGFGGYMYKEASASGERLARLETRAAFYEKDITEVKASLLRIEDLVRDKP